MTDTLVRTGEIPHFPLSMVDQARQIRESAAEHIAGVDVENMMRGDNYELGSLAAAGLSDEVYKKIGAYVFDPSQEISETRQRVSEFSHSLKLTFQFGNSEVREEIASKLGLRNEAPAIPTSQIPEDLLKTMIEHGYAMEIVTNMQDSISKMDLTAISKQRKGRGLRFNYNGPLDEEETFKLFAHSLDYDYRVAPEVVQTVSQMTLPTLNEELAETLASVIGHAIRLNPEWVDQLFTEKMSIEAMRKLAGYGILDRYIKTPEDLTKVEKIYDGLKDDNPSDFEIIMAMADKAIELDAMDEAQRLIKKAYGQYPTRFDTIQSLSYGYGLETTDEPFFYYIEYLPVLKRLQDSHVDTNTIRELWEGIPEKQKPRPSFEDLLYAMEKGKIKSEPYVAEYAGSLDEEENEEDDEYEDEDEIDYSQKETIDHKLGEVLNNDMESVMKYAPEVFEQNEDTEGTEESEGGSVVEQMTYTEKMFLMLIAKRYGSLHPLVLDLMQSPNKPVKLEIAKTGSKLEIFTGDPRFRGIIINTVPETSAQVWMNLVDAAEETKDDEPIVYTAPVLKDGVEVDSRNVKVRSRFCGFTLVALEEIYKDEPWIANLRQMFDQKMEETLDILTKKGIDHGHPHLGNFVIEFVDKDYLKTQNPNRLAFDQENITFDPNEWAKNPDRYVPVIRLIDFDRAVFSKK